MRSYIFDYNLLLSHNSLMKTHPILRNLYVAIMVAFFTAAPASAQRMPQDSWYLAKEFSAGGVGKFNHPQDVAVGPDGNLYVADSSNSQIQVLDADGLFLRSWNGSSAGVPNNSDFYPNAVAVAADGKVYITSHTGKVSVLKAGAEQELLAVNDVEDEVLATPALVDGRVLIRTKEAVICYGNK